ncbi:hypothetical protein SVEN_6389 [Streptomyces venezuelae ATCC 10712]|uniref:Uncharacterized protein n=1 Tax=Streptomyces venezuelae (strain ATCC 10712 / CBS 650.69 / DSM 40230 / JCM 4526 / NBRC 13096 / PD 04745) TaxID=953739 RepID=F2REZ0_STRVP|nr:hypothetical protein SVEN_6389 [Streptomyces venezuelae ATCC 10712]
MGAVPPVPAWNRPQHAPYGASSPQGQGDCAVTAGADTRAVDVRGRVLRRDMGAFSPTFPPPDARPGARHVDGGVDAGRESRCSAGASE